MTPLVFFAIAAGTRLVASDLAHRVVIPHRSLDYRVHPPAQRRPQIVRFRRYLAVGGCSGDGPLSIHCGHSLASAAMPAHASNPFKGTRAIGAGWVVNTLWPGLLSVQLWPQNDAYHSSKPRSYVLFRFVSRLLIKNNLHPSVLGLPRTRSRWDTIVVLTTSTYHHVANRDAHFG